MFWSALLSPAWGITISNNYRRLVSKPHGCQQDAEKATVPSFASESFNKDILYGECCDNRPCKRQRECSWGEEESLLVLYLFLPSVLESRWDDFIQQTLVNGLRQRVRIYCKICYYLYYQCQFYSAQKENGTVLRAVSRLNGLHFISCLSSLPTTHSALQYMSTFTDSHTIIR